LQEQIENEILIDYQQSSYNFNNPYVIIDPYNMNPLSALIIFDDTFESQIHVKIHGKDAMSDIDYIHHVTGTHYEIPVIGLYPQVAIR
jgi:arylsulfate sulfotransferase